MQYAHFMKSKLQETSFGQVIKHHAKKYIKYLIREKLFNDLVGQLVNINILVILQGFDLVQTLALLDHGGQGLDLGTRHLQHVVETIQHNLYHLSVLAVQQTKINTLLLKVSVHEK